MVASKTVCIALVALVASTNSFVPAATSFRRTTVAVRANPIDQVKDAAKDAASSVKEGARDLADEVKGQANKAKDADLTDDVRSAFSEAGQKSEKETKQNLEGAKKDIKNVGEKAKETVEDIAEKTKMGGSSYLDAL